MTIDSPAVDFDEQTGEMEVVFEAVLFAATAPVKRERLLELFGEGQREMADHALSRLVSRYDGSRSGVVLDQIGGSLRMVTRPDLQGYLRKFFEVAGSHRLTMAALETLSIVAYRQPVTAPEVQELRGVNPSAVLRKLLERRLIRIAGRKEVVGKPFLYATTRDFLVHFGLSSLEDLPPLEEFDELLGSRLEEEAPPVAMELTVRDDSSDETSNIQRHDDERDEK